MKKMMLKGLSDFLKVTELVKRSFIAASETVSLLPFLMLGD